MRVLFGVILGALLTVCFVFVADHWRGEPATTTGAASATVVHRPMVNWDVVDDNMHIVSARAHEAWSRLAHKIAG